MDGFKNSTRTQYMKGGSADCYAKGGKVKGAAKISKVMGEFKSGKLHSGSKKGPEVTNPKQAVAIALSEARHAGAKIPKKAQGGPVPTAEERRRSEQQNESLRRVAVSPTERRVLQSAQRTEGQSIETKTGVQKRAMGGMPMPPMKPGVPVPSTKPMIVERPRPAPMPVAPRRESIMTRRKGGGLAVMPRGKKC